MKKIAIVVAKFNPEITENLLKGALDAAAESNIAKEQIEIFWVPGAFEVSLIAKKLAKTNLYAAVVCLAAVIKKETMHFEYVCTAVTQGITQVTLETEIPILFGILTCLYDQAVVRSQGKANIGYHYMHSALEMIKLCDQIDNLVKSDCQ